MGLTFKAKPHYQHDRTQEHDRLEERRAGDD
jgi:hypothetical protein